MQKENRRFVFWFVAIFAFVAVGSAVAGLAFLPKDQPDGATAEVSADPSSGQPEGSMAAPSPSDDESAPETSEAPNQGAFPNGTTGLGDPYVFGPPEADRVLTIWEDMECPACAAFENDAQDVLSGALETGEMKIEFFIAPTGREGSFASALALACSADQDRLRDMHMTLFANQFPEDDKGYTGDMFVEIAEAVGMPDMELFKECLTSGKYEDYVSSIIDRGAEEGLAGTPRILLDGKEISLPELGWEGFVSSLGLDPKDYPYE